MRDNDFYILGGSYLLSFLSFGPITYRLKES